MPLLGTHLTIGLPWSYGVDAFSCGCVIAELYIMSNLFSGDIDGDREYVAAIDRAVGPFSFEYATKIETKYPGTFIIGDKVLVKFPPTESGRPTMEHAPALRRLDLVRPISVRFSAVRLSTFF